MKKKKKCPEESETVALCLCGLRTAGPAGPAEPSLLTNEQPALTSSACLLIFYHSYCCFMLIYSQR